MQWPLLMIVHTFCSLVVMMVYVRCADSKAVLYTIFAYHDYLTKMLTSKKTHAELGKLVN